MQSGPGQVAFVSVVNWLLFCPLLKQYTAYKAMIGFFCSFCVVLFVLARATDAY